MPITFARSKDILDSPVGRDFVALNSRRGQCVGMEDVSAEVWRLLASPSTLDDLCRRLRDLYDVDEARCRGDVEALLQEMIAAGLVEKTGA